MANGPLNHSPRIGDAPEHGCSKSRELSCRLARRRSTPTETKTNSSFRPTIPGIATEEHPLNADPRSSVSTTKTGAQIAKDISRRLFPEYLPLLEKEIASTVAYNKREDDSARLAQQIADLVQVSHSPKETTVSFYHSPYLIFKNTMSRAEVVDGNRVEIAFDVASETALKILNQLLHGRYELP